MLRERLLEVESDLTVTPSPYALAIKEFAALVKKYGKEAPLYLSYVYFMEDPRSRYSGYERSERSKQVSEALFGKKIQEDKVLIDAMREYARNQSSAMMLLEAARNSVTTLRRWLNNLDPDDDNYDVSKHERVLQNLGKTVNGLEELEKAVEKESEVSDTYGGVEVSRYNE